MSSRQCEDCESWKFAYTNLGEKFGTCEDPNVEGMVILDPDIDEYVIHTDAKFGCIYHTPLHGNVVTRIPRNEHD